MFGLAGLVGAVELGLAEWVGMVVLIGADVLVGVVGLVGLVELVELVELAGLAGLVGLA